MPIGLAIIGAGYWGPNLVRTAQATPAFRLDWLCDLRIERARSVGIQPTHFDSHMGTLYQNKELFDILLAALT